VDVLSHTKDIDLTQRALAWAAGGGQSKVVASLLQHPGVDDNLKVDGATPIYLACKAYSVAAVEILLLAGADPSNQNARTAIAMSPEQAARPELPASNMPVGTSSIA